MAEEIHFDRVSYNSLRKALAQAVADGVGENDTFEWRDRTFVVSYARYLVEHLRTQLGETHLI